MHAGAGFTHADRYLVTHAIQPLLGVLEKTRYYVLGNEAINELPVVSQSDYNEWLANYRATGTPRAIGTTSFLACQTDKYVAVWRNPEAASTTALDRKVLAMLAMQSKSYIPAVWHLGVREHLDSRLTTAFVFISWLKYRVFNYFRSNEFWRLAQSYRRYGLGLTDRIDGVPVSVTAKMLAMREKTEMFIPRIPALPPDRAVLLRELSTGTQRIIRLIVSLIFDQSSVMLVEHPEDGIHGGLLRQAPRRAAKVLRPESTDPIEPFAGCIQYGGPCFGPVGDNGRRGHQGPRL